MSFFTIEPGTRKFVFPDMPMVLPLEFGISLMIEQTITVGNIIEIASIVGGGLTIFAALRTTVANIKTEVAGIQVEIKKMVEVLVNQADHNRRLIHLEDDIRELRHGDGYVQGPRGIDREYPR